MDSNVVFGVSVMIVGQTVVVRVTDLVYVQDIS